MASSDATVHQRQRYGEHRPYPDPPARLADLTGPTAGTVELPITIDWGPRRSYDMAVDADRRVVYELVLQEAATTEQVGQYVNGHALAEVWRRLWLPRGSAPCGRSAYWSCAPSWYGRPLIGPGLPWPRGAPEYGFPLAGGYAVQAHHLVYRMSHETSLPVLPWPSSTAGTNRYIGLTLYRTDAIF
jgi:hypothetical protein